MKTPATASPVSNNRIRYIYILACIYLLFVLFPHRGRAAESSPPDRSDLGLYGMAELAPLWEALTFHVSFDGGNFLPDLAAGDAYKPKTYPAYDRTKAPKAEFLPGISGLALVLGTGAAAFPCGAMLPLRTRGSLALWVKPLAWRRPNGSNTVFLMSQRATFYLQRQGPQRSSDGRILRQEGMQFLAKSRPGAKQFTCLNGGIWENGRWVFVVANWSWPTMQLSIDGKPFLVKTLPGRPGKDMFAGFLLGARGGDRGLLDEVMAFDRPLRLTEVRQLRQAGLRRAKQP